MVKLTEFNLSDEMSFLRGTPNYVWCTTSVLGKGATGAVFQGVNRNTGEPVAVKTFNQLSHMRPQDVQMREFEVLKKVNHENIVKLLAIEEEVEGRGKVIVMELCTGGSLFNILDDPENTYGLQEKEFLLVVEHLSAGMKHLRDNNLVHRDLKPGNIMKFICDDGTTVYKLTDFGAARELQEDQQFMSLYGTEEYLHPDMYERAVLRKPVGKTFGATVDLWSIGVTLYHVATGNLPFRPYGGRRNKETMFYITTKKASGVIAGTQTTENGPIDWSRELPEHCQLSIGLKKVVTPLLAGLLEVDPQRIWSFDRFFSEVTSILSRKVVHVFNVNKGHSIKIFMHPDDAYDTLQMYITEQTDVTSQNQVLLLKHIPFLVAIINEITPGRAYPSTSNEEPLMLFSKENNNVSLVPETDIPKFPVFPNLVSLENDASQAKAACSVGHFCKRRVDKLVQSSRLFHDCVESFTKLVCIELEKLNSKCEKLCEAVQDVKELAMTVYDMHKTTEQLHKLVNLSDTEELSLDWPSELDTISKEYLTVLVPAIQQLYQRNVKENSLRREWEISIRGLKCPYKLRAAPRARTLIDRLRESWQHLLRDRATRNLSFNDEQFHVLEKIKVAETGRRIKALLETECTPAMTNLADNLADWYKISQTVYLQTMILIKDVDMFEKNLDNLKRRISNQRPQVQENLNRIIIKFRQGARPKSAVTPKGRDGIKILRNNLKSLRVVQEEINTVLRENSDLVNQFHHLTLDINKDQSVDSKPDIL